MRLHTLLYAQEKTGFNRIRPKTHCESDGLRISVSDKIRLQKAILHYEAKKVSFLLPSSPWYPSQLTHLSPPPPLLFTKGHWEMLKRPLIGIIGSRAATSFALKLAFGTASNLVRAGFGIVSGMARGIDAEALRGAYISRELFPAIAVLGTAITHCYPQEHFGLYHALCQFGLVLSEYPPGFKTLPYHFVLRNEIIAGLSDALLVVEAGKKSGTFHTVTAALNLGRPVITFDLDAEGNQALIQDGAYAIKKVEDVFPVIFDIFKSQKT